MNPLAPLLLAAPLAFGALLATRVFRDSDRVGVAVLAAGLGANGLLFAGNLFLHALPMAWAAPLAVVVLALAAAWLARLPRLPRPARPWGRTEDAAVAATVLVVFAYVVVALSRDLEDDYWMHAPLLQLLRDGVFPPVNPYLPDLPLRGHYGRALLIALVARLAGSDPLRTMTGVTALLQVASFLAWVSLGRRYLRSPLAAWLAGALPFFAVHQRWLEGFPHTGLLQLYSNNNALVSLDLALVVRALAEALATRRRAPLVVAGALLGLNALVYETTFAPLCAALLGVPILASAARGRLRMPLVRRAVAIAGIAAVLAASQGGTLTEVVRDRVASLFGSTTLGPELALQGATQTVSVSFPKSPFLQVTLPEGGHTPIWGLDFLGRAGWGVWALPFLLAACAGRRQRGAALPLLCLFGLISALLPATVGFGRFDNESARFLFYAGVAGTASLAWAADALLERSRRHATSGAPGRPLVVVTTAAACGACVVAAVPAVWLTGTLARDAGRQGLRGLLDPVAVLGALAPESFARADWEAARWIAAHARPGDRFLAAVPAGEMDLYVLGTLVALSGCPYAGAGIDPTQGSTTAGPAMLASGFRATAFWKRPSAVAAAELRARWILAGAGVGAALAGTPGFTLAARFGEDAAGSRWVLEALPAEPPPEPGEAATATWAGLVQRATPRRAEDGVSWVLRVSLTNRGPTDAVLPPGTFVRYFLYDTQKAAALNELDQVAAPVEARLAPGATIDVDLPLVLVKTPGLAARVTLGGFRGGSREVPR
ncbi:MAG: hypothetical protein HYZ53_30410 [Planctomycetes bacterium]|nr:hypothetical protein [Planctomycetota bacterium]